jgi:ubiquinone/menaquinone biosynthesis C-methylase UbiE
MSLYHDRILPVLTHLAMSNRWLVDYRRRTISAAQGRVLEVGIGSGINLPLYGSDVAGVCGIEPSASLLRRASRQQTAIKRELIRGSAETIPFEDKAFDSVVTTWTLCTIPDVALALREMRRVLRTDGRLLFVEHGLAPDASVVRWQERLTPCWKCIAGGCHLNRKIDDLIGAAGFKIERLDTGYLRGRNPLAYMYEGVARP